MFEKGKIFDVRYSSCVTPRISVVKLVTAGWKSMCVDMRCWHWTGRPWEGDYLNGRSRVKTQLAATLC